jgi:EAL domain-containing protein (putative c-di-GMP-specific phosphodiesterase class I)
LRRLGCRYMQGYYFARPMTAEKLRHHIADSARLKRTAA